MWTWISWYQVVSIVDFIEAQDDGCGCDNCMYKTCSSQIVATNKPTPIFFYRPDAVPVAQPTVSEQRSCFLSVGSFLDGDGALEFDRTPGHLAPQFLALLFTTFLLDRAHLVQDLAPQFVFLPVELLLFPPLRFQPPALLFHLLLLLRVDLAAPLFLQFAFSSFHLLLNLHRLHHIRPTDWQS